MTHGDALKLVALLRAAYPTTPFPPETARLYAKMLEDFPVDVATSAVEKLIATGGSFIPPIGQLRSAVVLAAEPIPDADEAWLEVRRKIGRVGLRGVPDWSCPTVAAAVEAVGWRSLCTSENEVADRAHFLKLYDAVRSREIDNRNVGSLTGRLPLVLAAKARAAMSPSRPALAIAAPLEHIGGTVARAREVVEKGRKR